MYNRIKVTEYCKVMVVLHKQICMLEVHVHTANRKEVHSARRSKYVSRLTRVTQTTKAKK